MIEEINKLPAAEGVYFFYNKRNEIIYVGKSKNIRKRVKQHFSGKDRKSIKIQLSTKRIDYEVTGSELIALLYESDLIKTLQPFYNQAQRRAIFHYGLYASNEKGYTALRIERIDASRKEITSFSNLNIAKNALFRITEKHNLCQKINGLYKISGPCFQYHIKECHGACLEKEPAELYNERVENFLNQNKVEKFTRLLELPGRTEDEIGLVYIENGVYKGFGFCPNNIEKSKFLNFIEPRLDNRDSRRILIRHLIGNL